MDSFFQNYLSLFPDDAKLLAACNDKTRAYGLLLSPADLKELGAAREKALAATGRVEFGCGVLEKLAAAFCDSPYLGQPDYCETLSILQDLFYHFKKECCERAADDDLLEAMKRIYNGPAHGSTLYLADIGPEVMLQIIRFESLAPLMEDTEREDTLE